MAGSARRSQVLIAVSVLAVIACWLQCTVQASQPHEDADLVLTAYLLEPVGAEDSERSVTMVQAHAGFPETRFVKTQVFDAPVFLEPDPSAVKLASYQGYLVFSSSTERSITITAGFIFTDSSDYPAGTRLHIRGSLEPEVLKNGGSAELSIVGGTGPLRLATGYATYQLVPDVGTPTEPFYRITLNVFLPGNPLRVK